MPNKQLLTLPDSFGVYIYHSGANLWDDDQILVQHGKRKHGFMIIMCPALLHTEESCDKIVRVYTSDLMTTAMTPTATMMMINPLSYIFNSREQLCIMMTMLVIGRYSCTAPKKRVIIMIKSRNSKLMMIRRYDVQIFPPSMNENMVICQKDNRMILHLRCILCIMYSTSILAPFNNSTHFVSNIICTMAIREWWNIRIRS